MAICERVGMRHRNGQMIELGIVRLPKQLRALHLQQRRLQADLCGGNGDAVLLGKVSDGLHTGICRVEQEWHRGHSGDRLHRVATVGGCTPELDNWWHAGCYHVYAARKQRIVSRCGTTQLYERDADYTET